MFEASVVFIEKGGEEGGEVRHYMLWCGNRRYKVGLDLFGSVPRK